MKVLAIGDTHGYLPKNLDNIIKKNKIELILCTGDFGMVPKNPIDPKSWTNKITEKSYAKFKKDLKQLTNYKLPFFTLSGNMFSRGESYRMK